MIKAKKALSVLLVTVMIFSIAPVNILTFVANGLTTQELQTRYNQVKIGTYGTGHYFRNNQSKSCCLPNGTACHGNHNGFNYTDDSFCNCKVATADIAGTAGGIQCFGYARYVFYQLFGLSIATSYSDRYKLASTNNVTTIGQTTSNSTETAKSILSKAYLGDFIQTAYGSSGMHSMIVESVSDTGVTVLECNHDGNCYINTRTISFSSFASTYNKFSLYRSTNHPGATSPTPPEPDTVSVSTDKKSYCVGENAIFSFNAENASSLHLYIYLDGNYWFQGEYTPSSTYTRYLSATGHYAYYIVAHYASGDIESAWNDFDVVQDFSEYIPAKPDVWAEKGQVAINEEVQIFHWSEKATSYLISIYKDGIWQYAETHYTSSFTVSFSDAGNYSVAVQAINNYGESSWNTLVVTVYAPVPQKPDVWVDTSLVPINQDVTIYHWSEKATSYLISVYKDGIWQYAETHYTSSFTTSFSDAGDYSIAVQAINDYGGSEWNTVSITVYCEIIVTPPIVKPSADGVVINEENYFIYGLSAGAAQGCVAVTDGTVAYEYSNVKQALGTGTKVNVYNNDNLLVDSYTVVVFGDVDGDSWYDGTDAYFVSLVVNGLIPQTALTDAQLAACDANHDGAIDAADVALIEQASLLLAQVDQTAPREEWQNNSVYLEYCSLIDQSAEITEPEHPTAVDEPQPATQTVWGWIKALFTIVFNWLLRVF